MTDEKAVEFFFSPGSRYCYLAGSQLPRVAARTRCRTVDRDVCLELAEELGLPRSQFDRALDDPATGELLVENARDAHARGAFGVPTLFLGSVMYWGNDRLVLLEHALTRS